jgi:hypothetical protein
VIAHFEVIFMSIRTFALTLLLISALAAAISGCATALTTPVESQPTDQSHTPEQSENDHRPTQTLPGGLEPVETSPVEPETGEVPGEILDEIFADLIKRTGIDRGDIQIMRAEAVLWEDGSLGCPKPGEFYIQMLIDGYLVVLQVEGVYYDYRVSDRGYFFLCEEEGSLPISPPEEGSPIDNPLVVQAKKDLAERLDISVEEIELLSFEAVVWLDASLDCPQPGMAYIQIPHDGALIHLGVGKEMYFYHSGKARDPFLCTETSQVIPRVTPKTDEFLPPPGSEID